MNELIMQLALQAIGLFVKDRALHEKYRQRIMAEMRQYNAEAQTSANVRRKEQEARQRLRNRT